MKNSRQKIKKTVDNLKKKVKVLVNKTKDVVSKKVSETFLKSVKTATDYLKDVWENQDRLTDFAKKKVKKKVLELKKLFEKTHFEIKEFQFLAGKKYTITTKEKLFPDKYLEYNMENIIKIFKNNPNTKIRIILKCNMSQTNISTGAVEIKEALFYSEFYEMYQGSNFNQIFDEMFERVMENMTKYTNRKSKWRFEEVVDLQIQVEEMILDAGGSFIPLLQEIAVKKAVINPKNDDNNNNNQSNEKYKI